MRATVLESFDSQAKVMDVPLPAVGPSDYIVRVVAASVNAFDWKIAQGMLANNFSFDFPVTIGRDFAGVISHAGPAAEGFKVGDAVFGCTVGRSLHHGSLAEYISTASACFTAKPPLLSFTEAAALPLSGMTALSCAEPLGLRAGQSTLVVGAPGGVGSLVVQLAARARATVVATGLPEDTDYLTSLGATAVIDYREGLEARVRELFPDGVDAAVDLVNRGEDFMRTAGLVVRGGAIASTHRQADPDKLSEHGLTAVNATSNPEPGSLAWLGERAAAGEISASVVGSYALEQAIDALVYLRDNHVRGKYVVEVSEPPASA
jgi:NADPH:quinone reductase